VQVIIYSTTTCPFCRQLKEYLSSKNIIYTEKMIDQDEESQKEMVNISGGFLGVPFTVILKDNGEKETIIGFDKGKINSVFDIK
jgi:glutaredoxin